MTFIVKVRGAGGLISAEYDCPLHGRFEATVGRDSSGGAPDRLRCPFLDYPGSDIDNMPCIELAAWTPSAPLGRVKRGEVLRGKSDPHLPHQLDTRPLAEGMPYDEWAKKMDKKGRDEVVKKIRSKVS